VRIHKPVSSQQQRLCQVFPVKRQGAVLRAETTGAVIRPAPQPEGDFLPGADTSRLAVQGFVDVSLPEGPGVTIAPWDAFALRLDLDAISFEAMGNDQNYREVLHDHDGQTSFRFRCAVGAHAQGYSQAEALRWSRSATTPLLGVHGQPGPTRRALPSIKTDPARAIATCLKPADKQASGGVILRIWEAEGRSGPISLGLRGYGRAWKTDLLERDIEDLPVVNGQVAVSARAYGFAGLRLLPPGRPSAPPQDRRE